MMLGLSVVIHCSTLQSSALTGALARAVPACEGRAQIEPWVTGSTLSALASNPTNIINAVGEKDGLCNASNSLFVKSLPQPSGSTSLSKSMSQLEPTARGTRRESRTPASASGARTAATAATPYTDKGGGD